MRKVFEILKKYLIISVVFSIIIFIEAIVSMVRSNTLPTINLIYIIKAIFGMVIITVSLLPGVAMVDWLIVKSSTSLFKDFKEADRKGRLTIIVVCIILLLRKILIWTR